MTEPFKTYLIAGGMLFASLFFPLGAGADGSLSTDPVDPVYLYSDSTFFDIIFSDGGDATIGWVLIDENSTAWDSGDGDDENTGGIYPYSYDISQFFLISGTAHLLLVGGDLATNGIIDGTYTDFIEHPDFLGVDITIIYDAENIAPTPPPALVTATSSVDQIHENLAHGVYIFLLTMFFMVFFFKRGV